jgi:hypothetical protein
VAEWMKAPVLKAVRGGSCNLKTAKDFDRNRLSHREFRGCFSSHRFVANRRDSEPVWRLFGDFLTASVDRGKITPGDDSRECAELQE